MSGFKACNPHVTQGYLASSDGEQLILVFRVQPGLLCNQGDGLWTRLGAVICSGLTALALSHQAEQFTETI